MLINGLKPAEGSRRSPKRVGRGIGSTLGKTSGKGHKGQKARAGGFHKLGFEGGQMPLQRRLPKVGFRSAKKRFTGQVRLGDLKNVAGDIIDYGSLKASGLIGPRTIRVRIIDSGALDQPVTVVGVAVSAGARNKIEALGGKVEV